MLIIFKANISICLSRIRVISNHGHSGWQPHRLQLGQWHNATTIKEKYLQIISGWYIRFNNGTWHILALVVASKDFSFFFSAISLQRWIIDWRSMLLNFISYILSFFSHTHCLNLSELEMLFVCHPCQVLGTVSQLSLGVVTKVVSVLHKCTSTHTTSVHGGNVGNRDVAF